MARTVRNRIPYDEVAEESLIGAMLVSRVAVDVGVSLVEANDFYRPALAFVFEAIAAQAARGDAVINPVTTLASLNGHGDELGVDLASLWELSLNVPAPETGAAQYAEIVRRLSTRRREIELSGEIAVSARTGDDVRVAKLVGELAEIQARTAGTASSLFRRWSMRDLLAEPDEFTWLIRGLLAAPTYGQIAGEMKTLKSYVAGFIAVGLAAGVPIFGHFTPTAPQPVLTYVGEGGRMLWTRRIRRICQAMGVNSADLDLHASFDTAPLSSIVFQESLKRDLAEVAPALTIVDPLYTFHGLDTRASDLMQEGSLLNRLSVPCMDAGSSSLFANHFNQGGSGLHLKRITMAGSGEWADSWLLLAHRVDPDVQNGKFRLTLDIGSRQWGGRIWDLDLDLGAFDEETGTHIGEITWDLRPAAGGTRREKRSAASDRTRSAILEALADQEPWTRTKTQLKGIVRGSREVFEEAFNQLADAGVIVHDKVGRIEAGTSRGRLLWALSN